MDESELIDRYLLGDLSPVDIHELEDRLKFEESLRKSVELRRVVIIAIASSCEDELRRKLKDFDSRINSRTNIKYYLMVAASIVIVLFIGIGAFLSYKTRETEISKYDISEMGLPNLMGESERRELIEGMSQFKLEHYAKASAIFDSLYKDRPNDTLAYFAGISHFRNDSNEKAVYYLKSVVNDNKSSYRIRAEYRLGLCYWKAGDLDNAILLFADVSKESVSDFSANSRTILNELQ